MKLKILTVLVVGLGVRASFASFEAAFTAKIKNDKMKQALQTLQNQIAAFKKSYKKEDVADIEIAQQIMAKLSGDASIIVAQANAKFGTPAKAAIATTIPAPSASASASTAAMSASQPIKLPPSDEEATWDAANVKSGVAQVPSPSASATMPSSSASAKSAEVPSAAAVAIAKVKRVLDLAIVRNANNDGWSLCDEYGKCNNQPKFLPELIGDFVRVPHTVADKKALAQVIKDEVAQHRKNMTGPKLTRWLDRHGVGIGRGNLDFRNVLVKNGIFTHDEFSAVCGAPPGFVP